MNKQMKSKLFVVLATAAVAFPIMRGHYIFMDRLANAKNNPTVNNKPAYNATREIIARRAQRIKSCPNQPHLFDRSNYGSRKDLFRWGVSTGNVPFFNCKVPKAGSTSLMTLLLLATGWGDTNVITPPMYLTGQKEMQSIATLPNQTEGLALDSPFVSLMFVREPMDRLVSAWKDKIHRPSKDRNLWFNHYTSSMLLFLGRNFGTKTITLNNMDIITGKGNIDENTCPSNAREAWDQGCRVSFKDFIRWIAAGNEATDAHWAPVSECCAVCQAGYDFIGHVEHYNEDIQVVAKLLKIDPSLIPDMYQES